jgi:hypothetical protein
MEPKLELLEIIFGVLGLLMLLSALLIAFKKPDPTKFQFWVFRVYLSLGVAFVGTVLPGFVDLEGRIGELLIRAGGTIALFLIVYFIKPPSQVRNSLNW